MFIIFVALALSPSYALFVDFLHVNGSTDAQISAEFAGAHLKTLAVSRSRPMWFVFALVEACFLGISWFLSLSTHRWLRHVIAITLAVFMVGYGAQLLDIHT